MDSPRPVSPEWQPSHIPTSSITAVTLPDVGSQQECLAVDGMTLGPLLLDQPPAWPHTVLSRDS